MVCFRSDGEDGRTAKRAWSWAGAAVPLDLALDFDLDFDILVLQGSENVRDQVRVREGGRGLGEWFG